ncbi:MAG: DUF438 domain-containing protein [Lachnospiraceae bacterium]|nr:DUF438 domain-containing protein [Lachnospiraceae bacterium]
MEKKLNLNKSVYELTNQYPELIAVLADLGFTEITKEVARNTVGKLMTIPKGAMVKGIDMVDVVLALKNRGYVLEGKMPDFARRKLEKRMEARGLNKDVGNPTEELDERTQLLKNYVERLSKGEDLESVRKDFVANFTEVEAGEIAKAEQALIKSGTPISEVQRLCDVHSALFHGATQAERIANAEKAVMASLNGKTYGLGIGSGIAAGPIQRQDGGDLRYQELRAIEHHPLQIFAMENEAIGEQLKKLRKAVEEKENLLDVLNYTRDLAIHYAEKGDLLYPVLKLQYGFSGPSDVMWGVDDEIRDEMRALSRELQDDVKVADQAAWLERLDAVITRAEEMIYKEENILYPLCAKNFSKEEWQGIARDFDDYIPCFIGKQPLWQEATPKQKVSDIRQEANEVRLPSGHLTVEQLDAMLNTIPMELTFIDEESVNRYFNDGKEMKLFKRPLMAIDREVFSCHPPKIEPMVRSIIEDFRNGHRNAVDVWNTRDGEPVLVKYMAVRDKDNRYVGTLECVQRMGFAKEHFEQLV